MLYVQSRPKLLSKFRIPFRAFGSYHIFCIGQVSKHQLMIFFPDSTTQHISKTVSKLQLITFPDSATQHISKTVSKLPIDEFFRPPPLSTSVRRFRSFNWSLFRTPFSTLVSLLSSRSGDIVPSVYEFPEITTRGILVQFKGLLCS